MKISEDLKDIIEEPILKSLLDSNSILDENQKKITFEKVYKIDANRSSLYKTHFNLAKDAILIGAKSEKENIEHAFNLSKEPFALETVKTECKISYERISPSQLVEYTYSKDGKSGWKLSESSVESLAYYKGCKFELWRKLLLNPSCKAQFRRTLRKGLINRIFDHLVFPIDPEEKHEWEVNDDKGKVVAIPRPVSALRIFDADLGEYREIDPVMEGAPDDDDAAGWWQGFLGELRAKHGVEFIDDILVGRIE